jgi:hypothetical protein
MNIGQLQKMLALPRLGFILPEIKESNRAPRLDRTEVCKISLYRPPTTPYLARQTTKKPRMTIGSCPPMTLNDKESWQSISRVTDTASRWFSGVLTLELRNC